MSGYSVTDTSHESTMYERRKRIALQSKESRKPVRKAVQQPKGATYHHTLCPVCNVSTIQVSVYKCPSCGGEWK